MPYQPDFKEIDKQLMDECGQFLDPSVGGWDIEDIKSFLHSVLAVECHKAYEEGKREVGGELKMLEKEIIANSHHPDQAWYDGIRCSFASMVAKLSSLQE